MKAHLANYRLFLVVLAVNLVLFLVEPPLAQQSAVNSMKFMLEVLSIVPPVMVLMGLLDVWIPRRLVESHLGEESGLLGAGVAILLGADHPAGEFVCRGLRNRTLSLSLRSQR